MNLKTLSRRVTNKVGRQVLTVRHHSPALLYGAGIIGVTTSVVLACRATLKLSDVLEEAEQKLEADKAHMRKSADIHGDEESHEKSVKNHTFSIQLNTAIQVVKLYAPAAVVLVTSVGAITGSHVILKRRNAALTAAYMVVDKGFKDYRKRVVEELGEEKDFEFRNGIEEREIVEEGPNGPETKVVRGLDPENLDDDRTYARTFGPDNVNWNPVGQNNQFYITMVQNQLNDLLDGRGYVFLSEAYDLLGFEPTKASQAVGWLSKPKINPETGKQENDGWIDFKIWANGIYQGKEWIRGNAQALRLDFNVDGPILDALKDM